MWSPEVQGEQAPLNIDRRFVVFRDVPGFYSYAIFEHTKDMPAFHLNTTRIAFMLNKEKFHYMVITDDRQRFMPSAEDRLPGRGEPLAYPEAVLLVDPVEPEFKGEVDDKYQYSLENKDNKVHGWICFDPPVGFWQITPSNEFRTGGPFKQDLTSHVNPTTLAIFLTSHYAGTDLLVKFKPGEEWKKVLGPVFTYFNSVSDKEMTLSLWDDACSLLHHCSKIKAFHYGLSLHAAAIKSGLQGDVFVSNHILNMYAKCGTINFARQIFNEMSKRNLVTWSAMIAGYDQDGKHLMAVNLYSQMPLEPNEFVLASALSSCASLLALRLGREIHSQSIKLGYSSISFVSNSLISMYMKNGQCSDALSVFALTPSLTDVSYNTIILGLVESNKREKAFEVYKSMCQQGLVPDRFTFVGLLGTCNTAQDLGKGMQLHSQTIKLKLDRTTFVGNIIMTMYSNLNLLNEADRIFRSIKEKDVISWNTLIAACSRCDDHSKALVVFKEMAEYFDGEPDEFTYASLLSACAGMGSMQFGQQIHAYLIRKNSSVDIGVVNALVNMYAKSGCIQYAYTTFRLMNSRNLVSWNSVIAGFANHGHGEKVIKLFEEMKSVGLKPDSVTFLGLLIACNHAGLVDEGLYYFNTMNEIYGITPDIEHFSCFIDLLGRAGRLKDAEEYMQRYPFGHDSVVLGCLLSACRLHGDVVIGERMAKKLLQLQPVSTSPYVLLSNLYASDEKWDSVAEARKMLKSCGLKKEAGHSLIEVKGSVEKFTIGNFANSRIEEIVNVLGTLGCESDEGIILFDSA